MENYKRVVSYLYKYRDGSKGKNCGYVRVEKQGTSIKIYISLREEERTDGTLSLSFYMPGEKERRMQAFCFGHCVMKNGTAEFGFKGSEKEFWEAAGACSFGMKEKGRKFFEEHPELGGFLKLDEIGGVVCLWEDALENEYFCSQWKDGDISIDQLVWPALAAGEVETEEKEVLVMGEKEVVETEGKETSEAAGKLKEAPVPEVEWAVMDGYEGKDYSRAEGNESGEGNSEIKAMSEDRREGAERRVQGEGGDETWKRKLFSEGECREEAGERKAFGENVEKGNERKFFDEDKEKERERENLGKDRKEVREEKSFNAGSEGTDAADAAEEAEERKPFSEGEEAWKRKAYNKEKKTYERNAYCEAEEQVSDGKSRNDSGKADSFSKAFRNYPRLMPFADVYRVLDCVRMEPQDIGVFPVKEWELLNNAFLLHGYYCFRHLVYMKKRRGPGKTKKEKEKSKKMGKMENAKDIENSKNKENEEEYFLGVPGNFTNRERFMAKMSGFPDFIPAEGERVETGTFGYWCRKVELA